MPAPILHLGATLTCSHAGPANPVNPFPRVLVSGQPVVTLAATYAVIGCALTGTSAPPCVTAQWVMGATRVLAGGVPLLTMAGSSTCIPTGTPLLPVVAQVRALAT